MSDRGFSALTTLRNLESLDLRTTTPITDDSLRDICLCGLPLKALCLSGTTVSDAGVAHICMLSELSTLGLGVTGVTDVGLASISRLTMLRELDLTGTPVTDDGMSQMSTMSSLRILWLSQTAVSDAGVLLLSRLKNLQYLAVGPNVSRSAVLKFHETCPQCEIIGVDAGVELFHLGPIAE